MKLTTNDNKADIENYITRSRRQSEIERLSTEKEKDGVFTGSYCINRLNGAKVPIWIADYVLLSYGTGAVSRSPSEQRFAVWAIPATFGIGVAQRRKGWATLIPQCKLA